MPIRSSAGCSRRFGREPARPASSTVSVAPSRCPPDVLAGIADLELVARIIVDGLVSGLHRSPFHGYSAEFSQYRHYQPGDDLKYVDWKLVARTDRVYTKQFRETTNMAAAIVVDTSASMAFRRRMAAARGRAASATPRRPKCRYAVIAAAALAHLISGQGDAVGLLRGGERFLRAAGRAAAPARRAGGAVVAWRAGHVDGAGEHAARRRAVEAPRPADRRCRISTMTRIGRSPSCGGRADGARGRAVPDPDAATRSSCRTAAIWSSPIWRPAARLAINAGLARRDYKDAMAAFLERWRSRAGRRGHSVFADRHRHAAGARAAKFPAARRGEYARCSG